MKNKRRWISLTITVLLLMCFVTTTNAGIVPAIKMIVNNQPVEGNAKLIDGAVYVPIETVGEKLGTQVVWDEKNSTLSVTSEEESLPTLIDSVSPSVVGIIGKLKQSSDDYDPYGENLVFGTGVIYKSNGFIITNAHVVSDMDKIVVVVYTGRTYEARLKAIDEMSDLALIKIDKGGLKAAVFGKMENVTVGQTAIAIGTPLSFSLRNSATKGIISGINRPAEGEYRFIQSDAAINGGNSGGPLVNSKGEVIGINSVKYTGYGVEGLSFSIPVDTVMYVVNQFEKYGKVRRPYIGAQFSESITARYGLPSNEGISIAEVEEGSQAESAGLLVDDVLTKINNVNIHTVVDYNEELKKYLPGDTVTLTIEREGFIKSVKVTFGESNE